MATITVRSYHPESGALLGNITTLDFGKITVGSHSRVKVLDIAFEGVSSVGNIKLGLISSGGITVADSSGSNGHFGFAQSSSFSANTTSAPLSDHFTGLNSSGTATDSNNKSVTARTSTLSNYIYLDVELGSTNLSAGNGAYKVFFDYS